MISEKLTGLMNAVRSKYALADKLSVDDATGYISKPELSNVVDGNFAWDNNNSDSIITNGVFRMVSANTDHNGITGAYMYYDQRKIIAGKRYRFDTLIRGNMVLDAIGEERKAKRELNIQLTDSWQWLSFNFVAISDIIVYAKSKKDDWMELKNWSFSELGGVIRRLLADVFPSRLEVAA